MQAQVCEVVSEPEDVEGDYRLLEHHLLFEGLQCLLYRLNLILHLNLYPLERKQEDEEEQYHDIQYQHVNSSCE